MCDFRTINDSGFFSFSSRKDSKIFSFPKEATVRILVTDS
jgi:hypothetical protein